MPKQGLQGRARQRLVGGLMALQVWQPVLAGVVATHPQVTQNQAANGVPVVNIATPGQSGISHNTYTRFDVAPQGLILNNSGQPVNTQLGGFIPGNANLPGGGARLILNEVSGQLPSQLKGYMEIAGQKAEMIIANPAGITCNGCGFINTSRGTLTTGKPLFGNDGSLSGFRVEEGALAIEGLGLNASNTDRVQLYSRALSLNAELHGRDLDVVTGRFEVDHRSGNITPLASDGTVPAAFAVDSSSLGGMYANRIRLIGTEAGVGMRLAAPVAALNGNLEITSNGDVRMVRASAKGDLSVGAAGSLVLGSEVTAGGNAVVKATDMMLEDKALLAATATTMDARTIRILPGANIAARGKLQLLADTLDHAGMMATANALQLDVSGQLTNNGSIEAESSLDLDAGAWTNRGTLVLRTGVLDIDVTGGIDNRDGSVRHAGSELTLKAATLDNRKGEIASSGAGTITVSGPALLLNENGRLQGNGALHINSRGLDNQNGKLLSDGLIQLQMNHAGLLNGRGLVETSGSITVEQSSGIDNSRGQLMASGDITLDLATSVLTNREGLIDASTNLSINHASGLVNQDGTLRAGQDLTLHLPFFNRVLSGGRYAATGKLAIHAADGMLFSGEEFATAGGLLLEAGHSAIQVDGRITSGGNTTLNAGSIGLGDEGLLATQGALNIAANTLTNLGVLYGRASQTLHIDDALHNGHEDRALAAAILSEGDITITRADGSRLNTLNNHAGQIESLSGNITVKAQAVNNRNIGWAVAPDVVLGHKPVFYHDDFSPTGRTTDIVAAEGSTFSDGDDYFELTWDDSIAGYPRDAAANSCTNGACYYFYRDHEVVTHRYVTHQGARASITAGGNPADGKGTIRIEAGTLNNNRSTISAAGLLDIRVDATGIINNIATRVFDTSDIHREMRWKACGSSGACSRGVLPLQLESQDLPSRTDQLITATLEGGVGVDLHGSVVNGEKEKVGRTVSSGTGAYANVPTTGPASQETSDVSAQADISVLDPTRRPGFKLPGHGVFQLSRNPAHPYLIETDPAINTYTGFLGSSYLINQLQWSPGVTQRRLGDSYYELMLIREALLASIGSRFVDASVTDERSQYEHLMQNAIAASESLELSPGVSLSRAQIDRLQQDMVWMEERLIAGERVLVPVVYLAQGSSRLLSDGAVIGGGTVDIDGEMFTNAGLVRSRNGLTITASGDIGNLGGTMTAAGNIELNSGADILNESGRISGHDVLLRATGDITTRTWSEQNEAGNAATSAWRTRVGETASITARGTLTHDAGGSIRLVAAELAGDSVDLKAGNSIILDTLQIDEGYRLDSGNWQQAESHVRHLKTQVLAARDLSLTAGADITAIAATLKAGTSATLEAGRDIHLLAAEETDHYEEHSRSDGSFGRRKSHDLVHDESRLRGTTITVGNADDPEAAPGRLTLTAGNNILFYASQATATGQADVDAGGSLSLIAGINTVSHREQSSKESAATYRNNDQGYIQQTAAASAISAGGDLNLNASKDIRLTASLLHTDQILRIGDEEVDPADLNDSAAKRPMNVMVDTLALTNESWNETAKGFKGPIKELVKGLSLLLVPKLEILSLGLIEAPVIEIAAHQRSRETSVSHAGSSLLAGQLAVSAHELVSLTNADVDVTGKAEINANDIVVTAVADRRVVTHDTGSETATGLGWKLADDELRVGGVEISKRSLATTDAVVEWNGSSINADQLVMKAKNDLKILGSAINVRGDADLVAGHEIIIGGNEALLNNELKETTEVTTVSAAIRNAYLDAALSVKAMADAADAIKEAKKALAEAESRAARGELDPDDVKYFRMNLAAATANMVQTGIAMGAALKAGAESAGTGFYVAGDAVRDKSTTTSTGSQGTWQGSTITVGGNATLTAAEKIKIQGSDVNVTNRLTVDAKKIVLAAGEENSSSNSQSTREHQGISISSRGAGSANAGMNQSDADSRGVHYVNTHLNAGTLASTSKSLQLAGAVIEAANVDIRTGKLSVVSLQDSYDSKSKSVGGNVGISGGPGGVTGASVAADFQRSESERRWVAEQSAIIGHGSIRINAEDTVLTGALIANASRNEQGELVDQGNLQLKTNTLTVNNLYDVDRTKTVGANLAVGFNIGSGTRGQGAQTSAQVESTSTGAAAAASKGGVPINTITAGGLYNGHVTERTTFATLGLGQVEVGGELLTATTGPAVNRDVANAQVITRDQDIGGLNASVTVDGRWFSVDGRAEMAAQQKGFVENSKNITIGIAAASLQTVLIAGAVGGELTGQQTFDAFRKYQSPALYQIICLQEPCTNNQEKNNQIIAKAFDEIKKENPSISDSEARTIAIGMALVDPKADNPNRNIYVDNLENGSIDVVKNIQANPISISDLSGLSNEQKQGFTVFNNGIFNSLQRAAELAEQQAPQVLPPLGSFNTGKKQAGNVYLVHTDKANTGFAEIFMAGLAKLGEISKATTPSALLSATAVAELSARRDNDGHPILDGSGQRITDIVGSVVGHSRGTSTVVSQNFELKHQGFYNPNLHIFTNNPAAFRSGIIESGSAITKTNSINIWAPPTDPVAHYIGLHDGVFSWKAIKEMIITPYSVHSCPGAGAIGCESTDVPAKGSYFDYSGFNRAINTMAN